MTDRFARIERAAYADGWLVVEQDGHTFRSRADDVRWERWPGDSLVFFDTDQETGHLCGVDGRLRYVRFDASLDAHPASAAPLSAPPLSGECRGGRLLALDTDGRMYDASDRRVVESFPLTSGRIRDWIYEQRIANGVRWGATRHYLYTWSDSARAWRRIDYGAAEVRGFLPRDANEAFVWDGHGGDAIVDRRTGGGTEVASLRGADIAGVFQTDSLWIAWGGRQFETSFRVEVAQTFYRGQFRGSRPDGFVLVSRDSGRSWEEIDRWPDGGVAALYVSPDVRRIVLLSYIGSVRELTRARGRWTGRDLVVATEHNTASVPYVQWPAAFYFADSSAGWLTGAIHHVGGRAFTTADGGRTWTAAALDSFPYFDLIPWRDGYIAHTRREVVSLVGGTRSVLAELGPALAAADSAAISTMSRVGMTDSVLVTLSRMGVPKGALVVDLRSGQLRRVEMPH